MLPRRGQESGGLQPRACCFPDCSTEKLLPHGREAETCRAGTAWVPGRSERRSWWREDPLLLIGAVSHIAAYHDFYCGLLEILGFAPRTCSLLSFSRLVFSSPLECAWAPVRGPATSLARAPEGERPKHYSNAIEHPQDHYVNGFCF